MIINSTQSKEFDDSNVVHKTGAETIAGAKTFTDDIAINKNSPMFEVSADNMTVGETPSSSRYAGLRIKDSTGTEVGGILHRQRTNGAADTYLLCRGVEGNVNGTIGVYVSEDGVINGYSASTPTGSTDNQIVTADYLLSTGTYSPTNFPYYGGSSSAKVTDFNALTTPGRYHVWYDTTAVNVPMAVNSQTDGILVVERIGPASSISNSARFRQTFHVFGGQSQSYRTFVRTGTLSSGNWKDWAEVMTSKGGTFTGEILTQHSITNAKNKSSADEFQSAMIFRDNQGQAFGHLQSASYADTGDILVKLSAVTGLRKATQDETTHYIGMGMRLDGTPYTHAPTPPANDDSTQIATTAWVGDNNAGSATKLKTARTIDGVSFDGSVNITHYSRTTDNGTTAAKTATVAGFKLTEGAEVTLLIANTDTSGASTLTLNVNNTGAKTIKYKNGNFSAANWIQSNIFRFVYDGTAWRFIGQLDTNTTSYLPLGGGKMTGAIKAGVDALICHIDDASAVRIDGGTTWGKGASLVLYGMSESSYKGQGKLRVTDGTNTKEAVWNPDGTFTWDGQKVACFNSSNQLVFPNGSTMWIA